MDDLVSYRKISSNRYLYISSLSKKAVLESDASHLGDEGYFIYEAGPSGIDVLAKVPSFESAVRLMEVFEESIGRAMRLADRQRDRLEKHVASAH